MKCRSEWQTPAAAVRIRTSCGPGLPICTSSITSGLFTSRITAAFIRVVLLENPDERARLIPPARAIWPGSGFRQSLIAVDVGAASPAGSDLDVEQGLLGLG